jgi:hypothetical protein
MFCKGLLIIFSKLKNRQQKKLNKETRRFRSLKLTIYKISDALKSI